LDDTYLFRKIKATAIVMSVLVVLQIMLGRPMGYYWNALQAKLSGLDVGVTSGADEGSMQSIIVYIAIFGAIGALALLVSPGRKGYVLRLLFVPPIIVYIYNAWIEYNKVAPIKEKFEDLYSSVDYAIYLPYMTLALFMAVWLIVVAAIPQFRVTQVLGWVAVVIGILCYLVAGIFVIYEHGMAILDGSFGRNAFFMYLICFAFDVVSYFFLMSVVMTYCTIKREERWDALEAMEAEAMIEEDVAARRARVAWEPLPDRVIPDIEELKEHEIPYADAYGGADESGDTDR
jgi:hypothetical protein